MANKKISELTQIGVANLTDTDQLVVVDVESSATRRMSVANIKQHIVESGDTNIHHFASYANSTFSTGGGGSGSADSVQTNLHSFASTANTNIDSVQSNLTAFLTTDSTGNTTVVAANLVPSADQTYNLGSPNYRWKTVYAAAQTIDLDGLSLSNEGGTLKVTDDSSGSTASFATNTGNLTVRFSNLESGISGANARIDVVAGNLDAYATYANATFTGAGGSGPANSVQTNLHSFATYANATFGSGSGSGDADSVQTNVHALGSYANSTFATSASVTANKTISDTLGTYANSTFATDTNLNTVQSNVTTNASTITANKSIGDTFGTYANSTFVSGSTVGLVQGNLDAFASYANSTFETNPDVVQSNLAHLGSTANTNIGTVQSNLTAMFTTNTRAITVGGATGANLVPQANNFFSLGSPTLVWKDLFVGPGTVTIGNLQLQDQDGGFTITSQTDPTASTTISGETGNIAQRFGNVIYGATGANTNINIVQGNADAYATYANATITTNKSIADTYGTYGNTTFSTHTLVNANVDAIVHGLTGANTNVTTNKTISDTYGSYANATFATTSYVDTEVAGIVDSAPETLNTLNELAAALGNDANLSVTLTNAIGTVSANAATNSTNLDTLGSYSNSTFATITNINTVSSNAATNTTNIDVVQENARSFAAYANATFSTVGGGDPRVDSVTDNLDHFGSYANTTFSTHTLVTANVDSIVHGLVGANATITLNKSISDTYGTYANSTFASATNINTVSSNVDSVIHGLTGANASITANKSISDTFGTYANSTFGSSADPIQSNLHALGSYANTTFATDTNLNTVSSNAATNTTTITTNKSISDTFGSYANSTFATATNLNTVSSNAATNTTNINTVQGNAAAFASYANSTFSALTVQDEGSALSTAATTLNFVGSGVTASGTGATKTITISGGGGGSGDADLVEANLDAFASYANSTFAAGSSANLASDQFTTVATSNTFTLSETENEANNVLVTLGGLVQKPNDDYIVSGTTLTLNNTNPLVAGIEVEARHLSTGTSSGSSGITTGKSIAMAMIFGF